MTTQRAPRVGVSWETDATDSHPSSMITLIDWLGANNNYSRYRSAHSKKTLLLEIQRHLLMQGIENRSVQDIRIQIEKLKTSYRHAYCWRYRMIQERENGRYASIDVIDFEIALHRICPHWTWIHEFMDIPLAVEQVDHRHDRSDTLRLNIFDSLYLEIRYSHVYPFII
ncbi:hypothetical protein PSHT_03712 [Puccinia striiformis]|uniref:Uncharacterized protein n=1 Tax=Puccinia striiformis TaxID=27350 RepID=A0A2S4WEZ0_9BASI|nr:hypothetical protein PSHT_03712 [Puccinia striiformis]